MVPLIKEGFIRAKADLLGRARTAPQGISVVWKTARDNRLQIIANFGSTHLPLPEIGGDVVWASQNVQRPNLGPHQIVVGPRKHFAAGT